MGEQRSEAGQQKKEEDLRGGTGSRGNRAVALSLRLQMAGGLRMSLLLPIQGSGRMGLEDNEPQSLHSPWPIPTP